MVPPSPSRFAGLPDFLRVRQKYAIKKTKIKFSIPKHINNSAAVIVCFILPNILSQDL